MTTKNEFLLEEIAGCSEALNAIEKARKALSRTAVQGAAKGVKRSECYKAFDAAWEAVIEYQRTIINS